MILHCKCGPTELERHTIDALKKVHPLKDVDLELAKMSLWLESNKSRRPSNLLRFIKTWLERAPKVESRVPTHASQMPFAEPSPEAVLIPMPPEVKRQFAQFVDKMTVKPWRH